MPADASVHALATMPSDLRHPNGLEMNHGSCLCGQVSVEIRGPLRNSRFCHCTNCRKFSGTAYAAWGVVSSEHLQIVHGAANVARFDSGGGLRVFCRSCGAPLWYEPAHLPAFRGVALGAIHEGEVPAPEMRVWTRSRVPWVSLHAGLPQYETHPKGGWRRAAARPFLQGYTLGRRAAISTHGPRLAIVSSVLVP